MESSSESTQFQQIVNYLQNFESRISRIEQELGLTQADENTDFKLPPLFPRKISGNADTLELQIGQYWFAKVGIVVLAVAIILILTFPFKNLHHAIPSGIGYILVVVLFVLSRIWKESLSFISRYIFGAGLMLLYFNTLRLHYFGSEPVIENSAIETILLLAVNSIFLFAAFMRSSPYLSGMGLLLCSVTAVVSGNPYFIFAFLTAVSVLTVVFKIIHEWNGVYISGMILVYATHLIWFINNPFAGNNIELLSSHPLNIYFILLYSVVFSMGNYLRKNKAVEEGGIVISSFINCAMGYGLFTLETIARFRETLVLSHLIASVIFLAISLMFWYRERSKYSTFFYAILGYAALSIAIIAKFPLPDFFVWLSWQSVLVVSTAVMFRSKIIIVANFVIYAIVFFAYLALAGAIGFISLSFGVVALLSARILNWQKDKLELKTDVMRLCYLTAAFFIFPYGLYNVVPEAYISLSWIAVALFYYGMSRVLNNNKYRWMAILTLLLTVGYVAIIGITKFEPEYRIISFSVLGVVLIVVSIAYTKYKVRQDSEKNKNDIHAAGSVR